MSQAELEKWLHAYSQLFKSLYRARDDDDGSDDRSRYIGELYAIAKFISTYDVVIGARFFELASKFCDLERGRQDPLFVPHKVRATGRLSDISLKQRAKARIVLAIEALVRTGTKPGTAIEEIADQLGPKVYEFAGRKAANSAGKDILKNWRKEFGAKRVKTPRCKTPGERSDEEAQILYEEGLTKIDSLLARGDRAAVLAIAQDVAEAAERGGVLNKAIIHQG